jgi:hypothetical protein
MNPYDAPEATLKGETRQTPESQWLVKLGVFMFLACSLIVVFLVFAFEFGLVSWPVGFKVE